MIWNIATGMKEVLKKDYKIFYIPILTFMIAVFAITMSMIITKISVALVSLIDKVVKIKGIKK